MGGRGSLTTLLYYEALGSHALAILGKACVEKSRTTLKENTKVTWHSHIAHKMPYKSSTDVANMKVFFFTWPFIIALKGIAFASLLILQHYQLFF